jgi:hypothetical protein
MSLCVLLGPWLFACGSDDPPVDTADSDPPATGAEEAAPVAEVPTEIATPAPALPTSRWPSADPSLYRVVEVSESTVLRGRVSASVDGTGVAFETPPDPVCDARDSIPQYPAGPLPGSVVWLEGVEQGLPVGVGPATVAASQCELSPRVQLAALGSELTVTSGDGEQHTLRLIGWNERDGRFLDYGTIRTADQENPAGRRLRTPGLVHVRSEQHPCARAWIYVTDNPYVVITGPEGGFLIEGVPPRLDGDADEARKRPPRTLHIWHEAFGEVEEAVSPSNEGQVPFDVVFGG